MSGADVVTIQLTREEVVALSTAGTFAMMQLMTRATPVHLRAAADEAVQALDELGNAEWNAMMNRVTDAAKAAFPGIKTARVFVGGDR